MSAYLSRTNPVSTHREGYGHIRDPRFQLDASSFALQDCYTRQRCDFRRSTYSERSGSLGTWNRCLDHLLTLAESHIESVLLAQFSEAEERCECRQTRKVLNMVRDLYASDRIWKDIGTYRNPDYVAPNKAKAIHGLVEYLSFELKGEASGFSC